MCGVFGRFRIFASLLSLGAVLWLGACATSKPVPEKAACDQTDWYEIGRRDGSQGSPTDRLAQHQKECHAKFKADWETLYINGRNAGLVEYCDAKNGFELGRMGIAYLYVCPSTVEAPFLAAYRKGQAARDLEMQNQKLDQKIDQLAQQLIQTERTDEQETLSRQLTELKQARAKNEQELNQISK